MQSYIFFLPQDNSAYSNVCVDIPHTVCPSPLPPPGRVPAIAPLRLVVRNSVLHPPRPRHQPNLHPSRDRLSPQPDPPPSARGTPSPKNSVPSRLWLPSPLTQPRPAPPLPTLQLPPPLTAGPKTRRKKVSRQKGPFLLYHSHLLWYTNRWLP